MASAPPGRVRPPAELSIELESRDAYSAVALGWDHGGGLASQECYRSAPCALLPRRRTRDACVSRTRMSPRDARGSPRPPLSVVRLHALTWRARWQVPDHDQQALAQLRPAAAPDVQWLRRARGP
jgi:hypothetical protein